MDVASAILDVEAVVASLSPDELLEAIRDPYTRISSTGIAVVPLATVFDAIQIKTLLDRRHIPRAVLEDVIIEVQRENPRDVRLHVDRAGKPAFLKLSDPLSG